MPTKQNIHNFILFGFVGLIVLLAAALWQVSDVAGSPAVQPATPTSDPAYELTHVVSADDGFVIADLMGLNDAGDILFAGTSAEDSPEALYIRTHQGEIKMIAPPIAQRDFLHGDINNEHNIVIVDEEITQHGKLWHLRYGAKIIDGPYEYEKLAIGSPHSGFNPHFRYSIFDTAINDHNHIAYRAHGATKNTNTIGCEKSTCAFFTVAAKVGYKFFMQTEGCSRISPLMVIFCPRLLP
ncbi:hypothetical protein KFU94_34885 [Chloroflexi bacterium TSY]|nr:hypothetical protein [Chloroflexi bacterium TSY]